jgi:quercetin dioxygenase-like cupin family protein
MNNLINLTPSTTKKIERIVEDPQFHLVHMIFNPDEGLPIHPAHANLYMTVLSGTLSIQLNDEPLLIVKAKSVVKVPFGTVMNVRNLHPEQLELLVIKDFPAA